MSTCLESTPAMVQEIMGRKVPVMSGYQVPCSLSFFIHSHLCLGHSVVELRWKLTLLEFQGLHLPQHLLERSRLWKYLCDLRFVKECQK